MQRMTISAKQWLIPPRARNRIEPCLTELVDVILVDLPERGVLHSGGASRVLGRRPESAPAEGFAWKAGKPAAQGYYAFALPKTSGK